MFYSCATIYLAVKLSILQLDVCIHELLLICIISSQMIW